MNKEYSCICGQIFDNPQKFNGHKAHCCKHIQNKYGDQSKQYFEQQYIRNLQACNASQLAFKERREEKINLWISEQHTCEKCGKVMTEKFGSGRFCSRSCANSHEHSKETKSKISNSIQLINRNSTTTGPQIRHEKSLLRYDTDPRYCIICGIRLPYELRGRQTCSDNCFHLLNSLNSRLAVERAGGNLNPRGPASCKYGTYKNFHCDSSWELAVVIYCLEHNILISRNTQSFEYWFHEERHKYYPDFIIDGVYTEIKNYWTDVVQAKIDYFPSDLRYQIWFYKDIEYMITYAIQKYGDNYCSQLYDRNFPCYLDNQTIS